MEERRQHRIYKIHRNEWPWGISYELIFDKGNGLASLSFENGCPGSFLSSLSVLEEKRRKGLGSYILRYCEKLSKTNGKVFVQAYVDPEYPHNLEWYKKRGYKEINNPENNHYILIEKQI